MEVYCKAYTKKNAISGIDKKQFIPSYMCMCYILKYILPIYVCMSFIRIAESAEIIKDTKI